MVQPRHGIGFYSERNPMNPEKKNPLFSFLNLLGQLILLSILWTVCCLPVITVGASTVALYYTVVKVLRRNQDSLFAAFFREFRSNFLQSLNINMVFLCYFGILAYFAIPRLSAAQSGADIGFSSLRYGARFTRWELAEESCSLLSHQKMTSGWVSASK